MKTEVIANYDVKDVNLFTYSSLCVIMRTDERGEGKLSLLPLSPTKITYGRRYVKYGDEV